MNRYKYRTYQTPAFTSPKFEDAKKTVQSSDDDKSQQNEEPWLKSPPMQSSRKEVEPMTKEFTAEEAPEQPTPEKLDTPIKDS
jgi:hypothetical protein